MFRAAHDTAAKTALKKQVREISLGRGTTVGVLLSDPVGGVNRLVKFPIGQKPGIAGNFASQKLQLLIDG